MPPGSQGPLSIHQNVFSNTKLAFFATLNLIDLFRLTNDPIKHQPMWLSIPTKLPSNIPSLTGNLGKILPCMSWLTTYGVHLTHWWIITSDFIFSIEPWQEVPPNGILSYYVLHLVIFHPWNCHFWHISNFPYDMILEHKFRHLYIKVPPHISLIIFMNGDDNVSSSEMKFQISF
jgi:hypothetical protein